MKNKPENILIGVSWPYTNGELHIGHLAGQHIVCDVFARYHRLKGNNVAMVSGSDMHGAPVVIAAEKAGLSTEDYAEKVHQRFLAVFDQLGLQWDLFTKTSTENHREVVQLFFRKLYEAGFIKVKTIKQFYDEEKKTFLADRYIEGTCPYCGDKRARGNQCEYGCGRVLEPTELQNPVSKLSGKPPVLKDTENFFLELPKLSDDLSDYLKDKDYWRKQTVSFARSWISSGLESRSVSRDIGYGIPVPIKGYEEKVIYVWFEAVIGYLSATIEWAQQQGDPTRWTEFWQNPKAKHYYFIAKDNIPFHAVIWPSQLLAFNQTKASKELPHGKDTPLELPYYVVANMFLNIQGEKLSKSLGNFVTAQELLDTFPVDLVRYFFVKFAPENHDIDFTWHDFIEANNNELAATLGNFVHRTLVFTHKQCAGKVPQGTIEPEIQQAITTAFTQTASHIEQVEFVKALQEVMHLAHVANKYLNDQAPWKNPDTLEQTMFNSLQLIQALKLLLRPFLPHAAARIHEFLNLNEELHQPGTWEFTPLSTDHQLNNPQVLFPTVDKAGIIRG